MVASNPVLAPGMPAQVQLEEALRVLLATVDPSLDASRMEYPIMLERAWHLLSRAIAALGD